jgi:Dolichyl-phosphate-mannose-protein mannosyltransferase
MKSEISSSQYLRIGLPLVGLVAIVLIFLNLGSFGMWEPLETNGANIVDSLNNGRSAPTSVSGAGHIEERFAAILWSVAGRSEMTTRLPGALMAILALAALFFVVQSAFQTRTAFYAAFILLSAPVFLFHGRQLTGQMPLLLAEILSIGGLVVAAFSKEARTRLIGICMAAVGLILGLFSAGLLLGVVVPTAIVATALAMNGNVIRVSGDSDESEFKRRFLVFAISCGVAILATVAFLVVVYLVEGDIPILTGGLSKAPVKPRSFDFAFDQLVYSWFPWSALIPISAIAFFRRDSGSDKASCFGHSLTISGVVIGYICCRFYIGFHGVAPCFVAVPVVVGVALAIEDLESRDEPFRLGALIVLALLVLMVRDFAQNPETLLTGYGSENLSIPKDVFKPVIPVALFSIPTCLLILAIGLFGRNDVPRFSLLRTVVLVPVAAICFGGYLSFMCVPRLSVHLSSKYATDTYERFRQADEPLGVFGPGRLFAKATQLETRDDLVKWLSNDERVFALFPPDKLADFDREFRRKNKRHIFVLDAKSDRFVLATSKALNSEGDENPITPYVRRSLFKPAPKNTLDVNFGDKVTLIGWELENAKGGDEFIQGREYTLTTYWRCDASMNKDYKIFVHVDGPGGRMHGDHMPISDAFSTREWEVGDYIKDVYTNTVPMYQKEGSYRIKIGLYKGSKRLEILGDPNATENAVRLGSVKLR